MIPKFMRDPDGKYYRPIADVFSATVKKAGDAEGQWIVQPHVIELTGDDAPEMPALAGDAIKPDIGNIVLCVTSRNNYDHVLQNRANRPTGANLIIVAVFSDELTRDAIFNVTQTLNVGEDLNVDGDALIKGNLIAQGNLIVQGNINVTGNITAAGAIAASAVAAGPVDLATVSATLLALQAQYLAHTHAVTTAPGTTGPPT